MGGVVINVEIFSRKGVARDDRAKIIQENKIHRINRDQDDEIRSIDFLAQEKIKKIIKGKIFSFDLVNEENNSIILPKGKEITEEILSRLPFRKWRNSLFFEDEALDHDISEIFQQLDRHKALVRESYNDKIERLNMGDELLPGVIKMVKVYVAIKRKLSVGDKMAGRHGNKGVVSRILPEEDMPFFEDGTPVDIVLNPLGVPSRMNVGQILETHLGWAAKNLGAKVKKLLERKDDVEVIRKQIKEIYSSHDVDRLIDNSGDQNLIQFSKEIQDGIYMETPVFDGASEDEIRKMLKLCNFAINGKCILYDGRTGEPFDQQVTVGVIYMLKLHHLVGDKIHARSIGPYSLVTQQPLGGKAQFGGQRLGEMEVWAMEAYGASHTLQEFLTIKSDDVAGRTKMYESIVKGKNFLEPGLPESFNVLIKELKGLGLDVELLERDGT